MVWMKTVRATEDTKSALLSGQGGPSRHPATARMKWSRDMNIAVMECYYLC